MRKNPSLAWIVSLGLLLLVVSGQSAAETNGAGPQKSVQPDTATCDVFYITKLIRHWGSPDCNGRDSLSHLVCAIASVDPAPKAPASAADQLAVPAESAPQDDFRVRLRQRRKADAVQQAKTLRRIHKTDPQLYFSAAVGE